MEWTDEQTLLLIELYRERPVLWDCRNSSYKNKNKRHDALVEMATILAVSRDTLDKKIHNVLSHFSRQLKKEKDSNKSGSGSATVYQSKWFCYNALLFLKDRNKPNKTTDTEEIEENESENRQHEDEHFQDPSGKIESTRKRVILPPIGSSVPTRKYKKNNTQQTQAMVDNAYSMMQEIYTKKSERDEYTVFGEQVAFKLRKLQSEHAKVVVQHIINTTLFEAQLGKYNHTFSTSDQIPPVQVNPYTPTNTPLLSNEFNLQSLSRPLPSHYPTPNAFSHTVLNSSGSNIKLNNSSTIKSRTGPKVLSVVTLKRPIQSSLPNPRSQVQKVCIQPLNNSGMSSPSSIHSFTAIKSPSDIGDYNISIPDTPSPSSNYSQRSESITLTDDEESIENIFSKIDSIS